MAHGWTAVLRIEDYPRSEMLPAIVSSYSTQYGWMNFNRNEAGPSYAASASLVGAASSSRMPAPMAAPPARFPTPPPTRAARRGAPPFYNSNTAEVGPSDTIASPSPPPPEPATGHHPIPNGNGGPPNGIAGDGYLPSSDEEEA
ncbi:unnamed protein product [Urochloa humidicola]